MMQAEVRVVLDEIIAHLSPDYGARVRGIPLKFDPDPEEVNAYAGCENGAAYMALTQGMLDALDGLSQTKATDELFGTQTYEAYAAVVVPRLVQPKGGGAALPLGTIPVQLLADARRLSRAHELFDDVAAFTFGHELAHHYLGHTPCAATTPLERNLARLGDIATRFAPVLNQPAEIAADQAGIQSVLVTARARTTHPFNEGGARMLLTFFDRLEQAVGQGNRSLLKTFLMTHPPSALRLRVLNDSVARFQAAPPP